MKKRLLLLPGGGSLGVWMCWDGKEADPSAAAGEQQPQLVSPAAAEDFPSSAGCDGDRVLPWKPAFVAFALAWVCPSRSRSLELLIFPLLVLVSLTLTSAAAAAAEAL